MKNLVNLLASEILEKLIENGEIDICNKYGERGYSLEEGQEAILFANWNHFDKYPNFIEWIENNYAIEWSDEWMIDYSYGKAYRCSPDSYGWERQFRITEDGEMLTPDDGAEVWIEHCKIDSRILGHTPSVLPSFIEHDDIIKEGFELIDDDLESGWYDRNDDPNEIAAKLLEEYEEVVFHLGGVGQFSINFEVYAKK